METILWSDDHTSLISEEEAYDKMHIEYIDDGERFILPYNGFEFEWDKEMWIQR